MRLQQLLGVPELLQKSGANLPVLHVAESVLDVLIRKMELLNTTEFNITSLLENAPETQQALSLMEFLPQIVELLMSSAGTPKVTTLASR